MTLQEYIENHYGELVKIGTCSAFMYIGVIDENTKKVLGKIAWEHKPRIPTLLTREVIDVYPSLPEINEGTIVKIEGGEYGKYWTKGEYDYFNNNHGSDKRSYRFDGDICSDVE